MQLIPGCLEEIGLPRPQETTISRLLQAFSAEEGTGLLRPHFRRVERIMYANALEFPPEAVDDCVAYLEQKRALLFKEVPPHCPHKTRQALSYFEEAVCAYAREHGGVHITKDDAIFRCFDPIMGISSKASPGPSFS